MSLDKMLRLMLICVLISTVQCFDLPARDVKPSYTNQAIKNSISTSSVGTPSSNKNMATIDHSTLNHPKNHMNGTYDINSQLFVNDATVAFTLADPDSTFSLLRHNDSGFPGFDALVNDLIDFEIISLSPLAHNYTQMRANGLTAIPFLTSAIVCTYRIDTLAGSIPVTLSLPIISEIMLGTIRNWADPKIVLINPYLTMPNLTITVIVTGFARGEEEVLTTALARSIPSFAARVTPARQVPWNASDYAAFRSCTAFRCAISTITLINGGFGYAALSNVNQFGLQAAKLYNAAGNAVTASKTATDFAFAELSQSFLIELGAGRITAALVNPTGAQAWPINLLVWLVVKQAAVNADLAICHRRAAVTSFLIFVIQSPQSGQIQDDRMLSGLPEVGALSISLVVSTLQKLSCNGQPSYELMGELGLPFAEEPVQSLSISGFDVFENLFNFLMRARSSVELLDDSNDKTITWSFDSQANSAVGYEKMKNGSVASALILLDDLSVAQEAEIAAYRQSTDPANKFLFLPIMAIGLVPIYSTSLSTNPSLKLPADIILDPLTAVLMLIHWITTWNSPSLVAMNPSIATIVGTSTKEFPVRPIWKCYGDGQVSSSAYELLKMTAHYNSSLKAVLAAGFVPCDAEFFDRLSLQSINQSIIQSNQTTNNSVSGAFPSPTEEGQTIMMASVDGGFGAVWYDPQLIGSSSVYQAKILFPGRTKALTASTAAFQACFDSFHPDDLSANFIDSQSESCYFFSRAIYAMIPAQYIDKNFDGCQYAIPVLRAIVWMINDTSLDNAFELEGVARAPANVRSKMLDAVHGVRCVDPVSGASDTMLISTPIVWSIDKPLSIATIVLSSVGAMAALVVLALLLMYRVRFLAVLARVTVGCALVYGSCILLVLASDQAMKQSSDKLCSGFSWLFHLGLMQIIAPQFVRVYRIYRIFSGRDLAVVKISTRRMEIMINTMIACECALLIAAQVLGPLQALDQSFSESGRIHLYNTCAPPSGAGTVILIVQCAFKALLLLSAALMAFATRSVNAKVGDSNRVAMSIYCLIGSSLLFGLLAWFLAAHGDLLIGLLVAGILLMATTTLAFSGGAQITNLTKPTYDQSADPTDDQTNKQFSLLSADVLGSPLAQQQYFAALTAHLNSAEVRLAMVKTKEGRRPTVNQSVLHNHTNNHQTPTTKATNQGAQSKRQSTVAQNAILHSPQQQLDGHGLVMNQNKRSPLQPQASNPSNNQSSINLSSNQSHHPIHLRSSFNDQSVGPDQAAKATPSTTKRLLLDPRSSVEPDPNFKPDQTFSQTINQTVKNPNSTSLSTRTINPSSNPSGNPSNMSKKQSSRRSSNRVMPSPRKSITPRDSLNNGQLNNQLISAAAVINAIPGTANSEPSSETREESEDPIAN